MATALTYNIMKNNPDVGVNQDIGIFIGSSKGGGATTLITALIIMNNPDVLTRVDRDDMGCHQVGVGDRTWELALSQGVCGWRRRRMQEQGQNRDVGVLY